MRAVKYWPYAFREHWFNVRMWIQKKIRGYSDSDVWNFYSHISKDIVTRLTALRKKHCGYPVTTMEDGTEMTDERWCVILDDIIKGYQAIVDGDDLVTLSGVTQRNPVVRKAMKLFDEYFFGLWD